MNYFLNNFRQLQVQQTTLGITIHRTEQNLQKVRKNKDFYGFLEE